LELSVLTASECARVPELVERGLVALDVTGAVLTLTLRGRLLADAVVRDLLD